jgi:hypothetical protein
VANALYTINLIKQENRHSRSEDIDRNTANDLVRTKADRDHGMDERQA